MHGQLTLCTESKTHDSNYLSIQTWPLQLVKNAKIILQCICITNARLLAYDVDRKMLGLDENGIAVMCFWIRN